MTAMKCDRCGAFYEAYTTKGKRCFNHIRTYDETPSRSERRAYFDLCPVCSDYLRSVLYMEGRDADRTAGGASSAPTEESL